MHVPTLVAALAIVVVAAGIFGYIAQRIGLVSIVGLIVAGIVIGPHTLGLIADDFELVEAMGEIGVIFPVFFIGLELGGDLLQKLGALSTFKLPLLFIEEEYLSYNTLCPQLTL